MRITGKRLSLIAALVTAVAVGVSVPAARASRQSETIAQYSAVPYMGVDTWYAFWREIDQTAVVRFTNSVVSSGLRAAGYRIVWLDAGWWQGVRDSRGRIVVDRAQWPRGMRWLASYIHSRGLLAGIYTDAGLTGCQNAGSYGHYRTDADTFARWGFDAVKVDFCGGETLRLDQRKAYTAFARAIRDDRPHRRMLFAVCNGSLPGVAKYNYQPRWNSSYDSYAFASKIATSWRTGPDLGVPNDVQFEQVLWNIALDARHPRAAGNGHWNDPDYLAPDQGMTLREERAQFTMWAILAAPLMLSANLGEMPAATLAMYENRAVIRIDQDPLGIQGRIVRDDGGMSVWVKPLSGGDVAVALLNRGARNVRYSVTASMIGIQPGKKGLVVQSVWRRSRTLVRGRVRTTVPEHGAVLLRVSRG
jgi:alpha-galactosidase